MEYSTSRVPPLAVEMKLAVLTFIKFCSEGDELSDPFGPLFDNKLNDLSLTQSTTAYEGVLNVEIKGIVRLIDGRDPPLRPQGRGEVRILLEENSNGAVLGHLECVA